MSSIIDLKKRVLNIATNQVFNIFISFLRVSDQSINRIINISNLFFYKTATYVYLDYNNTSNSWLFCSFSPIRYSQQILYVVDF